MGFQLSRRTRPFVIILASLAILVGSLLSAPTTQAGAAQTTGTLEWPHFIRVHVETARADTRVLIDAGWANVRWASQPGVRPGNYLLRVDQNGYVHSLDNGLALVRAGTAATPNLVVYVQFPGNDSADSFAFAPGNSLTAGAVNRVAGSANTVTDVQPSIPRYSLPMDFEFFVGGRCRPDQYLQISAEWTRKVWRTPDGVAPGLYRVRLNADFTVTSLDGNTAWQQIDAMAWDWDHPILGALIVHSCDPAGDGADIVGYDRNPDGTLQHMTTWAQQPDAGYGWIPFGTYAGSYARPEGFAGGNYVVRTPGAPLVVASGSRPFQNAGPRRLVDTRNGGVGLAPGQVLAVPVRPAADVGYDAEVAAVNLTVTGATAGGWLTAFPCGTAQPATSDLNYAAGQTVANLAHVKLGSDGRVCVTASSATHVIVDIAGWYPKGASFQSGAAIRVIDSRANPNRVPANQVVEVPGGLPVGARAAAINVTVVAPAADGWVTVYPCGTTPPKASALNFAAGQIVAGATLAALNNSGRTCVVASADTHLIVDVSGGVGPGSSYDAFTPRRLRDTRDNDGAPLQPGETLTIDLPQDKTPSSAAVITLTATASPKGAYLTVHPCSTTVPLASNLNLAAGQTAANLALTPRASYGRLCVTTSATTHVVVDLQGRHPLT